MPSDRPILVIAAMTVEVEPLVRRMDTRRRQSAAPIYWKAAHAYIGVTGVGARRARQRTAALLQACRPSRVIITGFAGSLSEKLNPGDVITPTRLLIGPTAGELNPTAKFASAADDLTMVSVEEIASTPQRKMALAKTHGAQAVDMESAFVADVCQQQGVGWQCIRAISDSLGDEVPAELMELVKDNGEPDVMAGAKWAMRRPRLIGTMMQLKTHSQKAAAALAERLAPLLADNR